MPLEVLEALVVLEQQEVLAALVEQEAQEVTNCLHLLKFEISHIRIILEQSTHLNATYVCYLTLGRTMA